MRLTREMYRELGYSDDEAAIAEVKAQAYGLVQSAMGQSHLSAQEVSRRSGVPLSDVGAFLSGDLIDLTMQRIARILAVFGLRLHSRQEYSIIPGEVGGMGMTQANGMALSMV